MAVREVDDGYQLPCGQDAAVLWEHVTAGQLDEHELGCPHCQAASEGFRALLEATGDLTEADGDLAPPRDLTERIMRAVRTERRRDAFLPRSGSAPARSCLVEQLPDEPDGWCAVRLDLTLRYGTDGMAAVARVRELITAAARELAGFEAARIDITVVDIWQEQA